MNLDIEVAKMRMRKADHQNQHYNLEDELLKYYPEQITSTNERIVGIENDIQLQDGAASVTAKFVGMTIKGKTYTEKEPAAKALLKACKIHCESIRKRLGGVKI